MSIHEYMQYLVECDNCGTYGDHHEFEDDAIDEWSGYYGAFTDDGVFCYDCYADLYAECEVCEEQVSPDDSVWCWDTNVGWDHEECMREHHDYLIKSHPNEDIMYNRECRDCSWSRSPLFNDAFKPATLSL